MPFTFCDAPGTWQERTVIAPLGLRVRNAGVLCHRFLVQSYAMPTAPPAPPLDKLPLLPKRFFKFRHRSVARPHCTHWLSSVLVSWCIIRTINLTIGGEPLGRKPEPQAPPGQVRSLPTAGTLQVRQADSGKRGSAPGRIGRRRRPEAQRADGQT